MSNKLNSIERFVAGINSQENGMIYEEFISEKKSQGLSHHTIRLYSYFVSKFLFEVNKDLKDITLDDTANWLYEYSQGKKDTSINLAIIALSEYFKFSIREGYCDTYPILMKRWMRQLGESTPKYYQHSEISKAKIVSEHLPVRNRGIFGLFLTSGIRRHELYSLNISDIDLINRSAKILGKGGKIRTAFFAEETSYLLKELIPNNAPPDLPLFRTKQGTRLCEKSIYKIIRDIGKKAQLGRSFYPHGLRHSFGSFMRENGAHLRVIANQLGHKKTRTTKIYTRIRSNAMYLSYKKCMG